MTPKVDRMNVDICAAILAEKPPQLPLREELNSLGFEIVLAAAGTGIRASKYESKVAVTKYRRSVTAKDLKKRRFFPKSSKRIRETLAERRRVEQELALPHACSYETYDIQLRSGDDSTESFKSDSRETSTSDSSPSNVSAKKLWVMFQRRKPVAAKRRRENDYDVLDEPATFSHMASPSGLGDFLVPDFHSESHRGGRQHPPPTSSNSAAVTTTTAARIDQQELWKKAFCSVNEPSSDCYKGDASMPQHQIRPHPQHPLPACDNVDFKLDSGGSQPTSTINLTTIDDLPTDLVENANSGDDELLPSDTASTCVLDGLEINYGDGDSMNGIGSQVLDTGTDSRIRPYSLSESSSKVARLTERLDQSFDSKFARTNESDIYVTNVWSSDQSDEEKKNDGIAFSKPFTVHLPSSDFPTEQTQQKSFEEVVDSFLHSVELAESSSSDAPSSLGNPEVNMEVASSAVPKIVLEANLASCEQKKQSSPESEQMSTLSAFERATAEILRAAGLDPQPTATEIKGSKSTDDNGTSGWITSAKSVIENISSEVLKAAGLDKNDAAVNSDIYGKESTLKSKHRPAPITSGDEVNTLFAKLLLPDVPPREIEDILSTCPELPQVRRNKDGRLPLHVLCDRRMLDRSSIPVKKLAKHLLDDIATHKCLIRMVLDFYPYASLVQDKTQDLPLHLISRRLMEWEATWYEAVYQKAAKERSSSGATSTAITKLYQTMSECVEMLLQPIIDNDEQCATLCRSPGSMGTILPLHIASIFTVSVKCLRQTLEAYPTAATIHCDLGILRTFIPDECLAIELHDNLSTDFPKWEAELELSVSNDDPDKHAENSLRRSDLLFAYNPIEPYRLEKARIRRIESRIQYDAAVMVGKKDKKLDRPNELLWIWMCTFREPDTDHPTYANSVRRIVSVLPLQSLRYLISVETVDGSLLLDAANDECLKVIQKRLERITGPLPTHIVPAMTSENQAEIGTAPVLGKDVVGHLCRLLFNVQDTTFPTSFIILPYKLRRETDGSLRLSSPESKDIATTFAECLQSLTEPRTVLCMLDSKSRKHFRQSLFAMNDEDTMYAEALARLNSSEKMLVDMYNTEDGYLYMIDEITGLPSVSSSDPVYPIYLHAPADLVAKLMPLMMMGMLQMRGDKAVPKLANIILDETVAVVPQTWIEAADLLAAHLNSLEGLNMELKAAHASLRTFLTHCTKSVRTSDLPNNGITEWNTELSILKKLIEMHDPECAISRSSAHRDSANSACISTQSGTPEGSMTTSSFSSHKKEPSLAMSTVEITLPRLTSGPDVADLDRKMDTLFQIQRHLKSEHYAELTEDMSLSFTPVDGPPEKDIPMQVDYIVLEEETSVRHTASFSAKESDDLRPRQNMTSRYSILFDDFSVSKASEADDKVHDVEPTVRIWNAVDQVWEDVTLQLQSRAETFCEDSQILHLKVALAEQAQKLSELGKKVSSLKAEERRLGTNETRIYDLTNILDEETNYTGSDSLSHARRLVLRMGDLEERLICDEIQIQHLSIGAFSAVHEGDAMVMHIQEPPVDTPRPPESENAKVSDEGSISLPLGNSSLPRELSGISWGSASNLERTSQRSFLLYEKSEPPTILSTGQQVETTAETELVHLESHRKPILVLDEYSEREYWYPVREQNAWQQPTHAPLADTTIETKEFLHVEHEVMQDSNLDAHCTVWERNDKCSSYVNTQSNRAAPLNGKPPRITSQSVSHVVPAVKSKDLVDFNQGDEPQISRGRVSSSSIQENNRSSSSPTTKVVRFSPTHSDEKSMGSSTLSRSQKLHVTKQKRNIPRIHHTADNFSYKVNFQEQYSDEHTQVQLEVERHDMKHDPMMKSTAPSVADSTDSGCSSVFRPTKEISVGYPMPYRELSAISSDRSHSSDVQNAHRVSEIEHLISRYTTDASDLSASVFDAI